MRFRLPAAADRTRLRSRTATSAIGLLLGSATAIVGWADVVEFDPREVDHHVEWNTRCQELGIVPSQLVLNDWVSPRAEARCALEDLADELLDAGDRGRHRCRLDAADAHLHASSAADPATASSPTSSTRCMQWVLHLDRSCVPSRAPRAPARPSTGAHLSTRWCKAGKRVGITAMSHHAIDNLLDEVVEVFTEKGDLDDLNAVGADARDSTPMARLSVAHASTTTMPPKTDFNLVAGTTWLFASKATCERRRSTC